jgi:hypothetical protein
MVSVAQHSVAVKTSPYHSFDPRGRIGVLKYKGLVISVIPGDRNRFDFLAGGLK